MATDFSKADVGTKVDFQNGCEGTITAISGKGNYHGSYWFNFAGMVGNFEYTPYGKLLVNGQRVGDDLGLDIVSVRAT